MICSVYVSAKYVDTNAQKGDLERQVYGTDYLLDLEHGIRNGTIAGKQKVVKQKDLSGVYNGQIVIYGCYRGACWAYCGSQWTAGEWCYTNCQTGSTCYDWCEDDYDCRDKKSYTQPCRGRYCAIF